jgi:hypothetical protein
MADYQAQIFDRDEQLIEVAELSCPDDMTAMQAAWKLARHRDVKLWRSETEISSSTPST